MQGRNEEAKLFVGGLPWALDSEDLREVLDLLIFRQLKASLRRSVQAFSQYGTITDANVVYDRETGRSRGFGFVTFNDKASAEKAVTEMNQAVRFVAFPVSIPRSLQILALPPTSGPCCRCLIHLRPWSSQRFLCMSARRRPACMSARRIPSNRRRRPQEIGGRTVNVNFAQAREPREGGFRGGRGGGGRGGFRGGQQQQE